MPRYRQLEHTADVRVEIYGRDLPELFQNACFCIFDVMLDHGSIREERTVTAALSAPDLPELFMDWLRELLFCFSTHSFAVASAHITQVDAGRVAAELRGETFDLDRHGLKVELKTPTYHQFTVEKTPEGYRACVIFDA